MSDETIVIDYSELIVLPKVKDTREYGFNSRPLVSPYDENILPSVKMKKLDRDLYRSIKFKKTKLIKSHQQSEHSIRDLKF